MVDVLAVGLTVALVGVGAVVAFVAKALGLWH